MDPLGPSTGFVEHRVVVLQELTDELVELAGAWARHRWGTSAGVLRVEPEARMLVVRGPNSPRVPAELAADIARGERPSMPAGSRRKRRRRW